MEILKYDEMISSICFVYQKYLILTFHSSFWLQNNLYKVTTREHKFKRWFWTQKPVLNLFSKNFWYTKIYLSQKYLLCIKSFIYGTPGCSSSPGSKSGTPGSSSSPGSAQQAITQDLDSKVILIMYRMSKKCMIKVLDSRYASIVKFYFILFSINKTFFILHRKFFPKNPNKLDPNKSLQKYSLIM